MAAQCLGLGYNPPMGLLSPLTTPPPTANAGILPAQTILAMLRRGEIRVAAGYQDVELEGGLAQIQPASIDLRLGHWAYPMDTSFLPGATLSVWEKMRRLDSEFEKFRIDLRAGATLEKGRVYVIPLQESIALPADTAAFANPKSSTGRLDILTRLIADGSTIFDQVQKGYSGLLYAEVTARSFSVVVRSGDRLNQLRFRHTQGTAPAVIAAEEWAQLLAGRMIGYLGHNSPQSLPNEECGKLRFTVDLKGTGAAGEVVGWRARKHCHRVDLARRDYDPLDYWEPIHAHSSHSLILDPDEFYILMTREAVAVPPGFAAEMVPYDTRAGEFRVHYAGFFDPGFGWNAASQQANGSKGVLEVRSHEVPFLLEHGQTVGWLLYERMAEPPEVLYGQAGQSNYQHQQLKLGKQFRAPA